MTKEELWEEFYNAVDELHNQSNGVHASIAYLLSTIDFLVMSGMVDPHLIQNEKILARIDITQRKGFLEEYATYLPNAEAKPINYPG